MNIGKRLLELRKQKGLTQKQVADSLGWVHTRLTNYENGKRAPRMENLSELAKLFGISLEELVSDKPSTSAVSSTGSVPLISWVRAGSWSDIEDHGDNTELITTYSAKPSKHSFALRVEGDSMTAPSGMSFPEGCIIVVDPERSAKPGDYVVAKDVLTQQATFKRLVQDGGRWFLRPLNPSYLMIEIDDPAIRVIGVAIEWQMGGKL